MIHLQEELEQLKQAILQSLDLAISQVTKSKEALLHLDTDLAEEILHNETRMNAYELSIDRDCENIFALYNPVATDLRLVVSVLKINSDIERIGDHAASIASYIVDLLKQSDAKLISSLDLDDMFETAISMLNDVREALDVEDARLARKVFKKDKKLDKINEQAPAYIEACLSQEGVSVKSALYLYSVIKKLERVGDLTTNIAEDIIFYLEAKVLKHKKNKKK